jgi:hypothetical protein
MPTKRVRPEDVTCYDCRYYHIDPDCRGIELCRNWEPKRDILDDIVDNFDCVPEGIE